MENKREIRIIGAEYAPRIREASEDESRTIEGYAIVFDRSSVLLNDYWKNYTEIIHREAVSQQLLDESDIKMTLWHNRERLLARRDKGQGSLEVGIDEKGVWYRFEAPHTPDGDTALELVKRGDLTGSSFTYTTNKAEDVRYDKLDDGSVVRHVMRIGHIYDITIASDPAYTDTSVNAREMDQNFTSKREDPNIGKRAAAEIRKTISTINA